MFWTQNRSYDVLCGNTTPKDNNTSGIVFPRQHVNHIDLNRGDCCRDRYGNYSQEYCVIERIADDMVKVISIYDGRILNKWTWALVLSRLTQE